jgi:hypothetical protein
MQNREKLRQKEHDRIRINNVPRDGENIIFRNGGGRGNKYKFEPKYRPLVSGDIGSHYCILTQRQQHWT